MLVGAVRLDCVLGSKIKPIIVTGVLHVDSSCNFLSQSQLVSASNRLMGTGSIYSPGGAIALGHDGLFPLNTKLSDTSIHNVLTNSDIGNTGILLLLQRLQFPGEEAVGL